MKIGETFELTPLIITKLSENSAKVSFEGDEQHIIDGCSFNFKATPKSYNICNHSDGHRHTIGSNFKPMNLNVYLSAPILNK